MWPRSHWLLYHSPLRHRQLQITAERERLKISTAGRGADTIFRALQLQLSKSYRTGMVKGLPSAPLYHTHTHKHAEKKWESPPLCPRGCPCSRGAQLEGRAHLGTIPAGRLQLFMDDSTTMDMHRLGKGLNLCRERQYQIWQALERDDVGEAQATIGVNFPKNLLCGQIDS